MRDIEYIHTAHTYGAPFVKILYLTDLAQKLLSLAEIAISACRDVICGRDSYLCMQRYYLWKKEAQLTTSERLLVQKEAQLTTSERLLMQKENALTERARSKRALRHASALSLHAEIAISGRDNISA